MTPSEVVDAALGAGAAARRDLDARGIDPNRCRHLVESLENALAGMLAAAELGWPVEPRRAHLAEVRRRLSDEPLLDRPPEPPRRFSLRLALDLNAARAAASGTPGRRAPG
jgi:hypothetical protein